MLLKDMITKWLFTRFQFKSVLFPYEIAKLVCKMEGSPHPTKGFSSGRLNPNPLLCKRTVLHFVRQIMSTDVIIVISHFHFETKIILNTIEPILEQPIYYSKTSTNQRFGLFEN